MSPSGGGRVNAPFLALAAAGVGHDSGAVPTVLLALAFAIVCAKLAGELVERLGQPAVLGELIVGILAGNATSWVDPTCRRWLRARR